MGKMTNEEVAKVLENIADMLAILGESPFRVRAYLKAANAIRGFPEDIKTLLAQGKLKEVRGIGESIALKVQELVEKGRMSYYEELKEKVPPAVLELMEVPHVGPRKAKVIFEELGISTVDELLEAIERKKLRALKGFGGKTEEKVKEGILLYRRGKERILLSEALPLAEGVIKSLRKCNEVIKVDKAGSLRRMKETIGDIDILASSNQPREIVKVFTGLSNVSQVLASGETKGSVVFTNGLQADLRVVSPSSYGAALQYFTGSKEHNIILREIARKKGLKISEYGVFDLNKERKLGGESEKEVYETLGLPWIPPPLREGRGEVEAALKGELPQLVEESDIKGDLHIHSIHSDGSARIEEIIKVAEELDYEYVALCDHARRLKVARGMNLEEIEKRAKVIESLNQTSSVKVLSGIELNIENDGSLDYPDEILSQFDFVVASIHWGFNQTKNELTRRILKAMDNPYVHGIAHPTGRIIGKREPYLLHLEEVFKKASETGTYLEINSFPDRLDLKDEYLKYAKEKYGCKFFLGTDAHGAGQMSYMRYGVATAQRGWLEPQDILNTLPLEEVKKSLAEKKSFKT
jgi:DNA polymerase (family 10)